jgi:hypothetical protein
VATNGFSQGHALLIGVGSYTYKPQLNIPISVADAKKVAETLQNPQICGYPEKQITTLHDETATRESVLTSLSALAESANPSDTVFFFYCGHGDYGLDGLYYLTTSDTQVESHKVVPGTGVAEQELIEKIRAIRAKGILMVFNACHSGEISPALGGEGEVETLGSVQPPARLTNELLASGRGKIIISACRPDQLSYIGKGALSIFSQAVVDGLSGKGGVPNNSGYISAYGLYTHIYDQVFNRAKDIGHIQEPELTVLQGVGPFPVALYSGGESLGVFDPELETLPPETRPRIITQTTINVSGGFYQPGWVVSGNVYQSTGDMYINQTKPEASAVANIFQEIMARADGLPDSQKGIAKPILNQVQEKAEKIQQGDTSEETQSGFEILLRGIVGMIPDIAEVALSMLANPMSGVTLVIQKIAQKIKNDLAT